VLNKGCGWKGAAWDEKLEGATLVGGKMRIIPSFKAKVRKMAMGRF